MRTELVEYLVDAISRAEAGNVKSPYGSWAAGMFGKAANLFEKEFRCYTADLLEGCGLLYPVDFVDAIKASARFEKLTLGQLIAVMREAYKRKPQMVAQHLPGGWKAAGLISSVDKINDVWVRIKHGEEVQRQILVERMKAMLMLSKAFRTNPSKRAD